MSNTTTTTIGLMRKTKKELIDIILRKDDVEQDLRDSMEALNIYIEDANKEHNTVVDDRNRLVKELNKANNIINCTKQCEKKFKFWAIAATITTIMLLGAVIL